MLALILALALAASPSGDPASSTDASAPAAAPAPDAAPAQAATKTKRKSKRKSKKTKTSSKRKKSKKQIAKDTRDAEIGRAWLAAHGVPSNLPTVAAPAPSAAPAPVKVEVLEPMPAMKQAATEALVEAKQPAAPAAAAAAAAPAKFASSMTPTPGMGRAPRQSLSVGYTPGEGSIYKLSPAGDTTLILAGVLGTVLPYAYNSRLVTPMGAGDPTTLNALDQKALGHKFDPTYAWASNITAAASVGLPMLLDLADLGPSSTLVEDAVIMTEVMAITGGLATAAKYGLQRRTPLLYGGDAASYAGDVEQYKSFYSAQTAVTFAALSATAFTLSNRYDQNVWPWLATAAIGGSVAAERVATGRAFYTDVIAGAVAGVAVGTLVPWLHLRTGVVGSVIPTERGIQVSGGKSF